MKLWMTLWKDERGFVLSAEMILIATIACIGLIVGDGDLSRRDRPGVGRHGRDQRDESVVRDRDCCESCAGITVVGDTVTITSTFGDVTVTASFQNYDYADQLDLCETTVQTAGEPPCGHHVPGFGQYRGRMAPPAP